MALKGIRQPGGRPFETPAAAPAQDRTAISKDGSARIQPASTLLRSLAQRREIAADACGVDPEIAAPETRYRAHVDPAAGTARGDPDHDIVGKAEPAAPLARLDMAGLHVGGDDAPAHLLRRHH